MKKFIAIILGVVMVTTMSACMFFGAGGSGSNSDSFAAIFDRNGFAVVNEQETSSPPVIFEDRGQLDSYILKYIDSMDWLHGFPKQKSEFISSVNLFYAKYDNAFFESHRLIIAHIDSGSGSLSFSINGLRVDKGVLVVNINRFSPAIQTMDYNRHIMFLSVARDYTDFNEVRIKI